MSMVRRAVIWGIFLLVLGLGAPFFLQVVSVNKQGIKIGGLPVAQACGARDCRPQISGTLISGPPVSEEVLQGSVVLLNLWATWCGPCAYELPDLQSVYNRYKDDGFVIVGLLIDDDASDTRVKGVLDTSRVTYPIVRPTTVLELALSRSGVLPMSYLYDQDGMLIDTFRGAISARQLERAVKKALATK